MIEFSSHSLMAIFGVSLVAIIASAETGHFFGTRVAGEGNISTLEAAVLGLLALMISFTFAMALTRFDTRRDVLLGEANSIGTAALRARLLPAPRDAEALALLKDYLQIRLDIGGHVVSPAELRAAVTHSNEIQETLWMGAKALVSTDHSMAPTGLYIQALNEMFDNQEKRLTAMRNRVPNIVLLTLYGITFVAIGFTGYASGLERRRWRMPVYIMVALVAAVILLIQDLDRPSAGFISVSQQPMVDTAASIDGYIAALRDP